MAASKFTGKNMKINERSLASFASSRDGIDKEGYLNKKGEVNRGYQRRWFILKGNLLFYYEKPGDKQPVGVIILENCNIEVSDGDRFAFSVSFGYASSARTYILCADNEKEMEHWMKCITAASYKYTQMVVKEFEKTLSRIRENELKMTRDVVEGSSAKNVSSDLYMHCDIAVAERSSSQKLQRSAPKAHKSGSNEIKRAVTHDGKSKTMNSKSQSTDLLAFSNLAMASQKFKGGISRSKSSENIQKLQKHTGSQPEQKVKMKNSNNGVPMTSHADGLTSLELGPVVAYELEKSTFEILHTSFGAAIWTKVGEHGQHHVPVDFSSVLSGSY